MIITLNCLDKELSSHLEPTFNRLFSVLQHSMKIAQYKTDPGKSIFLKKKI